MKNLISSAYDNSSDSDSQPPKKQEKVSLDSQKTQKPKFVSIKGALDLINTVNPNSIQNENSIFLIKISKKMRK